MDDDKLSDQNSAASECSGDENQIEEEQPAQTQEDLINKHPQQTEHQFSNGITISSKFDSGCLYNCKWNPEEPNRFELFMSGDGLPYTRYGHYYSWFYFSVKGAKPNEDYVFSIRNMGFQQKLYKLGLRPVYRIAPHAMKWRRFTGPIRWELDDAKQNLYVTWTHNFGSNFDPAQDTAYWAWTYPYSFEESLEKSQKWIRKFAKKYTDVYTNREVICYSREKRPVELLTFTKDTKRLEEREDLIEDLFPEAKGDLTTRPFKFDKPTIFISARVHPGETPASYVLDGIMKFLLRQSEQSKILLEKFVFKIVPQLNPDGVYRGYWRLDTLAQNLNRFYSNPSKEKQPTIYGVKAVIVQQHKYKKLDVYVDLHAHANKRGCFMFGNNLTGEAMLKNMLLPKLVSLNSLNFDWMECSFAEGMMHVKDKKDGLSREGCGRVSIMQAADGLPNCYTLECNYASGRRINHISQKLNVQTGQVEPELPITDAKNRFYTEHQSEKGKKSSPPYTIEVFQDIGRAFMIGLLDFYDCNPVSRLPMSIYKSLEGVKNDLLQKNNIFIPKKKEEVKPSQPTAKGGKPLPPQRQDSYNVAKQSLQQVVQPKKPSSNTTASITTKATTTTSGQSLSTTGGKVFGGKKNLQKVGSALVQRNKTYQSSQPPPSDSRTQEGEESKIVRNKSYIQVCSEKVIENKPIQQSAAPSESSTKQSQVRRSNPCRRSSANIKSSNEKLREEKRLSKSNSVQKYAVASEETQKELIQAQNGQQQCVRRAYLQSVINNQSQDQTWRQIDPSYPQSKIEPFSQKQGKGIWDNHLDYHHPQMLPPTSDIIIHHKHHDPQNSVAALAFENMMRDVIRKMPDPTRPTALDYNKSHVLMHSKVNHPSFDQRKSAALKHKSIVTPKIYGRDYHSSTNQVLINNGHSMPYPHQYAEDLQRKGAIPSTDQQMHFQALGVVGNPLSTKPQNSFKIRRIKQPDSHHHSRVVEDHFCTQQRTAIAIKQHTMMLNNPPPQHNFN